MAQIVVATTERGEVWSVPGRSILLALGTLGEGFAAPAETQTIHLLDVTHGSEGRALGNPGDPACRTQEARQILLATDPSVQYSDAWWARRNAEQLRKDEAAVRRLDDVLRSGDPTDDSMSPTRGEVAS